MASLTRNLFWGQGERDHALEVVEGHWPDDMDGSVFVVGPDKRRPEGHWFNQHGILQRIRLAPDADGRIRVEHRRIGTRIERIRRRVPWLFKTLAFMEVSPFGVSNSANTGVCQIDDRLLIGYDAGRPVEVDPTTMEFVTPVGGNDEWLQALPGLLEPLCAVAAHPAPDYEEHAVWFLNYDQVALPGMAPEARLVRWDLEGPLEQWRLEGMSPYDSIHDVKVTENHVVFCDLPFVVEPGAVLGRPRTLRNQEHTNLWIVAKDTLAATPPGGAVPVTEVRIPMPTGHLSVDYEETDGTIRVVLQQIPLADLMLTVHRESTTHDGSLIDPNYEGLIALAVQPSVIGRYVVDVESGAVREADTAVDVERSWGGILATSDVYSTEARRRQRTIWYAGLGFDPDIVPKEWWDLYGDATDGIVAPPDLPTEAIGGSVSRIDLEAMKVAEVHCYEDGAFPSPPTFVPRAGTTQPDDGYLVVTVHQDGPKEVQVFDALHLERGPLARATSPTFNPGLLLHSTWMPDRVGPRRSRYRIGLWQDLVGAVRGIPSVLKSMASLGRRAMRDGRLPE